MSTDPTDPSYDYKVVKSVDWIALKAAFNDRLNALAAIADGLPDNPDSWKIAKDLIIPAIVTLRDFLEMIEIEPEENL